MAVLVVNPATKSEFGDQNRANQGRGWGEGGKSCTYQDRWSLKETSVISDHAYPFFWHKLGGINSLISEVK